MKRVTINYDDFESSGGNQLKIKLPSLGQKVKIVDAWATIGIFPGQQKTFTVNYSNETAMSAWGNVDEVFCGENSTVKINVSDEVQDALNSGSDFFYLSFSNAENTKIEFVQNLHILNIDYLGVSEYADNSTHKTISLGESGSLSVGLANGQANLNIPLISSDENVLPVSLSLNHNSNFSDNLKTGLSQNNLLNVHQFLIKQKNKSQTGYYNKIVTETTYDKLGNPQEVETTKQHILNLSTSKGLVEGLTFSYLDENFKEQFFEERYFYYETEGDKSSQKHYVNRSVLSVDLDGALFYVDEYDKRHSIETELETQTSLKLVSSIAGLYGSNLVDYEPEELANVKDQIKAIESQREQYYMNYDNCRNQLYALGISKYIMLRNIASTYVQNYVSSESTSKESEDVKTKEDYDEEIFKELYIDGFSQENLYDTLNEFVGKDYFNSYDGSEPASVWLKKMYEKLKNSTEERAQYFDELDSKVDGTDIFGDSYNKTAISDNQILNTELQIESYKKQFETCKEYISDVEDQLKVLEHQKELLEMQVPVHYLYNDSGVIYGFGKTDNEDIFRLILVLDSNENSLLINYEDFASNRIQSITKSNGESIVFEYNHQNMLEKITDANGKQVKFEFSSNWLTDKEFEENYSSEFLESEGQGQTLNQNTNPQQTSNQSAGSKEQAKILTVTHVSGLKSKFIFDGSLLSCAINSNGIGACVDYDDYGNVDRVSQISAISKISVDGITQKEGFDFSKTDFEDFVLSDEVLEFVYNNYCSTSLTDGTGKKLTYIFNKYGKITTVYEGEFDGSSSLGVNVSSFEYSGERVSKKFTNFANSENYFADSSFGNMVQTSAYHLGGFTLGADKTTYNYLTDETLLHEIKADATSKTDEITMSSTFLSKINSGDNLCSHRTFIVSGWAKANSAFVAEHGEIETEANENQQNSSKSNQNLTTSNGWLAESSEQENTLQMSNYISSRRFEIKVVVEYADEIETFSNNFDWRNTNWQFTSVPITLKNKQVVAIKCYIDYSNNTGKILYKDPDFREGDFECNLFDDEKRLTKSYSGHSIWQTEYFYDANSKLVSKSVVSKKDGTGKNYVSTYEYSASGKLLRKTDANGIVYENIYNDKGVVIKTMTYNKEEPTSKFYEETIVDDTGKETKAVNALGEEVSTFEYEGGTGRVQTQTDSSGNKTAYGYDEGGNLVEVSNSANGLANTNTVKTICGKTTSLKHNDFEVNFEYDGLGRVTGVFVAGETYLTKTYSKNNQVVNINGEKFEYVLDDDGNVLECYHTAKGEAVGKLCVQNVYDTNGNLTYTKNALTGDESKITYDNFGNIISEESSQNGTSVKISNEFDSEHNKTTKTTINLADEVFEYEFNYSNDPSPKLEKIVLPNGESENIACDKLGRVSGRSIDGFGEEYHYLKSGDHATNLVSKQVFVNNGKSGDHLTYVYDKLGNITEIRANNKLQARFSYDELSRLIREDNRELNKTTTYLYDAGGNIVGKNEYAFTLVSNLDSQECKIILYSYNSSGWRDQMVSYDGKVCEYDSIGNPYTYMGNTLVWKNGRQLAQFGDIATFEYNSNGIRTSKTANGTTTKYYLSGSKILRQEDSSGNCIDFIYGAGGVVGFRFNDKTYLYKKNILGDIIGILDDESRTEIVKYIYNAWGKCEKTLILSNIGEHIEIDTKKEYTENELNYKFIAILNPFRYRSYYFDFETELYYLNSRYYDPETGRFINADDINYLYQNKLNGINLYAYCLNNPINLFDYNGNFAIGLLIALGILLVGTVSGGAIAGKQAYDNGVRGWDLVKSIIIGGSLGLAVAGAGLTLLGVGLGVFSVATFLGLTSVQVFAIGALAYNFTAFVIAPIFGFEMQGIEYEESGNNKYKITDIPYNQKIEMSGNKILVNYDFIFRLIGIIWKWTINI